MSLLQTVLTTAQAEFADLADIQALTRELLRMVVALLLGAAIGWDRERRDADAGLRTHMLVALGAAFFVLVPAEIGMSPEDLSRVIQGVIAGVGFLGAGAVLKLGDQGRIHGLTTAASIWVTAAVGMAAGLGRIGTALVATVFILLVLSTLRRFSRRIRQHPTTEDADD